MLTRTSSINRENEPMPTRHPIVAGGESRYLRRMIFEQIRSGGCLSYVVGCEDTRAAVIVDPELDQTDRYLALIAEKGLRAHYAVDTHTHADHFTAARELG